MYTPELQLLDPCKVGTLQLQVWYTLTVSYFLAFWSNATGINKCV